ncbi:DegT/DnrJ/EryC1/StrS family aminotransferase [bacterium]|mgnify:CR=1 FL=1|nr:DegT/DnrJ/EryC1/StrS family aminotransferase [bacterium]
MSALTAPAAARPAATGPVVPFADLSAQLAPLRDEILSAVDAVLASGHYVLGPHVAEFEEAFAAAHSSPHAVGVSSGTAALHLALLAAGVGPGDEVLTTPMTFIATSWAVSYCGARPVFVDVDPATCTMDPNETAARVTRRTRAILPVHLYGQPADLGALREVAFRSGVPLIEDAAQAHGAHYSGRPVGSFGLAAGFSFYPGKNLGACGEGGIVVTGDATLAARVRALRDHAQTRRYHHAELGFNYRMDAIQGAILGVKLRQLGRWTERRRHLARRYLDVLRGVPVRLPEVAPDRDHVWHLFVVRHPRRDDIRRRMEDDGIQTGLHYPIPVHLQPAYRNLGYEPGDFPVAERVARESLSLPLYPEMTEAQQDAVVSSLTGAVRNLRG